MTWEFDNFLCAVGSESTESAVYSLTTNTLADMDGTRVQIQATIRDDSEQGRLDGTDWSTRCRSMTSVTSRIRRSTGE